MRVFDRTFRASAALFVLAGLTGVLFRLAGAAGLTLGLDPVHVRHAHSHLMYFGWATPVLFALIGREVRQGGGAGPSGRLLATVLVLAVVAWAAFLHSGYGLTAVGPVRLPVSIVLSTLSMLAWYTWAAWFLRARRTLAAGASRTLLDGAVAFLVLSTLGAWGVAALVPAAETLPALKAAFAHVFLAWFSQGWFVLALLGIAFRRIDDAVRLPGWAVVLFSGGVALSFLTGMPGYLVPERIQLVARVGAVAWGSGLVGLLWTWWRSAPAGLRRRWAMPVLVLAAAASTQVASMFVADTWWADLAPMRVLYLHVLLLGFVTPALAAEMVGGWRLVVVQGVALASVALLLLLTPLWPEALSPVRPLTTVAWGSLGMPLAAVLLIRRRYGVGAPA